MAPIDFSIRHIFTPKALLGGSSSVTGSLESLKKAKTSERPKVHSQHKYKGDQVLTRTGKRGATVLSRIAKAFKPKVQPGGNGTVQSRTRANALISPKKTEPKKDSLPQVPPKPFFLQVSGFEHRINDLRGQVETLNSQRPDPLSTKKEQFKAETAMLGAQMKLKSDVDKALTDVGKLLTDKNNALKAAEKEVPPDQNKINNLKDEVLRTKDLRRDLIAVAVGADFMGLRNGGDPVAKGGIVTGLWTLLGKTEGLEHDYLQQHMGIKVNEGMPLGMGTLEIGRMIDDFNGGRPIRKDDGTVLTPAQFQKHVEGMASTLENLFDSNETARKVVTDLKNLSCQIGTKIAFAEGVLHLEKLLDKKPDFPLSSVMNVISSAFDHSREFGNSSDPRKLEAAASSLAHFAEAIAKGEVAPALHGLDPKFDTAILPIKQSVGGDQAVAKLKEDRAKGPLPSNEMIALLDKKDIELSSQEQQAMLALVAPSGGLDDAREFLMDAREALRVAHQSGGDTGVQQLREERAKGPLPPDHLIALLDKPDDKLTLKERVALFDLVGKGPLSTLAEAREILTRAKDDINKARESGKTTVALRQELVLMDKKLSKLLTTRPKFSLFSPSTWGTAIKGAWYTPNKWGAGERVTNTLIGVKIDAQFMKGLLKIGGEQSAKDVAIMVARFAHLQQQTLLSEQRVLGLHQGFDYDGVPLMTSQEGGVFKSIDSEGNVRSITGKKQALSYETVDPANPLKHFGISNEDLKGIGLTDDDIRSVGDTVKKLNSQGVGSMEEIHDVTTALKDVAKIVLKSELAQENIAVYEQGLARMQGQHLLHDILMDGDMSYRQSHLVSETRDELTHPLRTTDKEVVGHFQDRNKQLMRGLDDETVKQMKVETENYKKLESTVGSIYGDHLAIQTELETRHDVLVQASKDFGIDVDPDDPRGLRSAKQILIAVDSQAIIDDPNSTPQQVDLAVRTRDEALKQLDGFDTSKMRIPFGSHFRRTEAPTMEQLRAKFTDVDALEARYPDEKPLTDQDKIRELATRELRSVAESMVYIRETGPMGMVQLEKQLSDMGTVLEGLTAHRRDREPEAMRNVTTMIRAAVLSEWQNAKNDLSIKNGEVSEGFDPSTSDNRKKIEATLVSWGLDISLFAPEIDSVLFSRMTADDMQLWRNETQFSQGMIEHMTHDPRPIFNMDRVLGRRVMDTQTRGALLGMLDGFQEGDKLDLKAGQRITLDTGKIPVEPTGLAGIRARLAGAHIGQFEIEMGSDGIKLHVRTGGEVKGNVDAVVGKKFGKDDGLGPNLEARLEASVGLEGSGSRLTGMTITFDKGTDGRQALINLVSKMIDNENITVKDWQSATDVGYTYENRAKGGANVKGDARIMAGGKPDSHGSKVSEGGTSSKLDDEFLGVGVSAGASAGIAIGGKWVGTDSLNQVTRKGEVELSTTMGVNAGIYAQFYNVMNMGTGAAAEHSGGQQGAKEHFGTDDKGKPLYNITSNVGNYDLLNMGLTVNTTSVRKWKLVTTPDGHYTGGEKVRQSSDKSGVVAAFASCLDTPQMKSIMKSSKPEHQQFVKDLEVFMKLKGPTDQIAVKYSPKPEILEQANALITRALAAENEGDFELGEKYRAKAEKLMMDDSNYFPKEVGLITTDIQKREDSVINARWIRWDQFSDGKSEHRGLVLGIPAM